MRVHFISRVHLQEQISIFLNFLKPLFYCALKGISIKLLLVYSFLEWLLSAFANELPIFHLHTVCFVFFTHSNKVKDITFVPASLRYHHISV